MVHRIEVHARDWLKAHGPFVLRAMPFHNIADFGIHRLNRCVFVQLHIGTYVVVFPCGVVSLTSHPYI